MSNPDAVFMDDAARFEEALVEKPATPKPSPTESFTGGIDPTEVSLGYKAGLACVAFGMALLLAVYAGLILLAAYWVYYHLRHNISLLDGSGSSVAGAILYVGPAVAGLTLIFFLVKPYFAGKPAEPAKYSLTAESDPVLFAFIARICELVRAPLPSRVDVDCQVNASAGFRRGFMSMKGNDVVLTIGLPLAAGLTQQEFAGVLAHEFGHFAQGAGMRLTYVIRQTNAWFARVVYERDEWDVNLTRAAHRIDFRIGVILQVTRFCVWVSRRILWALMHVGHAISCFMLRQMEYDADSYEAKLAGSAAFATTTAKIRELAAASQLAYRKMEQSWRDQRLPENLPGYITLCARSLPVEMRQKMDESAATGKTKIFDSHPCDADRIRAARALDQAGVFHLTEPASELFKGFAELSKAATKFHYEHNLRLQFSVNNLVSQTAAEEESQTRAEGEESLRNYFLGLKWTSRPIMVPEEAPASAPAAELIENLKQARSAMEQSKAAVEKALTEYASAEALHQRGLDAILQNSQEATAKAVEAKQGVAPALDAFAKHAEARLINALQLLYEPAVVRKIPDLELLQKETATLAVVLARLGLIYGPLQELRRQFGAFTSALQVRSSDPKLAMQADKRVNDLIPELERLIKEVQQPIEKVPYPFSHGRANLTLEKLAQSDIPASHKLEALYNNCHCHVSRLMALYQRVLGRLTFIALKVEEQV